MAAQKKASTSTSTSADAIEEFDTENAEPGAAPHGTEPVATGITRSGSVDVYPPEGKIAETAQALSEAAVELGGQSYASQVQYSDGVFNVPADVADKASLPRAASTQKVPEVGDTTTAHLVETNTVVSDGGLPTPPAGTEGAVAPTA